MGNKNISWKIALATLYPKFKDKAFLSNLIQRYKHGSDNQPTTTSKRPINEVSLSNQADVAAATNKSTNNSNAYCSLNYDKPAIDLAMMNYFANYQETNNKHTGQASTGVEHHGPSVNNIIGNSERNTEDTHIILTPRCHQK